MTPATSVSATSAASGVTSTGTSSPSIVAAVPLSPTQLLAARLHRAKQLHRADHAGDPIAAAVGFTAVMRTVGQPAQ
jgi:hypothetical protein